MIYYLIRKKVTDSFLSEVIEDNVPRIEAELPSTSKIIPCFKYSVVLLLSSFVTFTDPRGTMKYCSSNDSYKDIFCSFLQLF